MANMLELKLLSLLVALAYVLNMAACQSHASVPNCTVVIGKPGMSPSFFNVLDGHEAMTQVVSLVRVDTPEPDVLECKLDIGTLLDRLPDDEVMVLYIKLVCPAERKFQLILENANNVTKANGIGYLWSVYCKLFWKDIAVYGHALSFRVLFLQNFEDQFEEELGRYGAPPKFPAAYDTGLAKVGTFGFFHHFDHQNATLAIQSFPRIFREYAWLRMAEITLYNLTFNSVPEELIETMPQLQTLDLPHCRLSQPPSFFPWDPEILNLPMNLSRSPIGNDHYAQAIGINVPPNEYRRIYELKHNKITDLMNFGFSGFIQFLSLIHNGLKTLGAETFRNTQHLQSLTLASNRLQKLPRTVFHGLVELVHLDLNDNILISLDSETFRELPLLKTLTLSNNQLTSIGANSFSHLLSLELLDVSSNNLTYVDDEAVLVHANYLRVVNFARNNLAEIPPWLFLVRNLRNVDISDNHVSFNSFRSTLVGIDANFLIYQNRQTASSFSGAKVDSASEKSIDMRRNYFTTVPIHELNETDHATFSHLLMFFEFDLDGNPITCDCNSFSFYEYLLPEGQAVLDNPLPQRHIDSWKCTLPAAVKGIPMVNVPPTTFQCPANFSDCPAKCTCYRRSVDGNIEVDCRNQSLTRIPDRVPSGTQVLYMDKNSISRVTDTYPYFENLTNLTLSYNNVSKISDSVLRAMPNLTHLSLQNNRLQYLPGVLKEMEFEIITLRNNPLVCDCYSKWVKYWLLSQRHSIQDMEDLLCTTGKPQGKHIVEARDSEYVCEISTEGKAVIAMAVFIVVVSVAVIIIYRYRGEIKLFLYVHFNWHPFDTSDDDDCDKKYDAFVSYSGIDYRWVCHILRKKVELREPPYKLCLHDRDFIPGYPIQENIQNAISDSRRMIIILSKNYIQSEWCLYEFRAAHHKVMKERCNFLIVIKCSDVSMNDLDEDLQLYLRTNTYLDVTNKWFWEKLFYTLPQNPLSVLKKSASDQQKVAVKSPAATAPPTSPLVAPPEECIAQVVEDYPVAKAPNYGATAAHPVFQAQPPPMQQPQQMPMAQPQVFVMMLPQQAALPQGGNTQTAFIPYQINMCTPWAAPGCVQAETGETLYPANGYMPFPGGSFLPGENPPVGYQDSKSSSEEESCDEEDEDSDDPDEANTLDNYDTEMCMVNVQADNTSPDLPSSSESQLLGVYDSGVDSGCSGNISVDDPLLRTQTVSPFVFSGAGRDVMKKGNGSHALPVSPDSATPLIQAVSDVTCV